MQISLECQWLQWFVWLVWSEKNTIWYASVDTTYETNVKCFMNEIHVDICSPEGYIEYVYIIKSDDDYTASASQDWCIMFCNYIHRENTYEVCPYGLSSVWHM